MEEILDSTYVRTEEESRSPFWMFDRSRVDHPWEHAFRELHASSDLGRLWVSANWRMDHRVSEEREVAELGDFGPFGSIAGSEDWWEARGQYFAEEICRPASAAGGQKISAYL